MTIKTILDKLQRDIDAGYYETGKQEAEAAIHVLIERAYAQGKIDEAKICEQAQRHDKRQQAIQNQLHTPPVDTGNKVYLNRKRG